MQLNFVQTVADLQRSERERILYQTLLPHAEFFVFLLQSKALLCMLEHELRTTNLFPKAPRGVAIDMRCIDLE